MNETLTDQERDSQMVFAQVSQAADNIDEAKQMHAAFYIPDMTISRSGISRAIVLLEEHFEQPTPARL